MIGGICAGGVIGLIRRIKNRNIIKVNTEDGKCTVFLDDENFQVEEKVLKLTPVWVRRSQGTHLLHNHQSDS